MPDRTILMPTVEERLAVLETWREEHVRSQDRRDAREWKVTSLLVAVAALVATVIGLLLR